MPRQRRPTPETLERQLAADSQLGDLDEHGLERLPDFDEAPPGRSREDVLADLDERADRLNGHSDVRPSERCPAMAPESSSLKGMRCTFHQQHDGRHSWQNPEASSVASSTDELPTGQAQLPGTPDPDTSDDFAIPNESSFAGKDFVSSPGLKAIGERLIGERDSLSVLDGVDIRYLWKRRGGTSGGNPKLGALQRPGGMLRYFTGGVTFIAYLSADHCRDLSFTPRQIEAALFHQLLHADTNPDDDDAYRIRGHSFEGFVEEFDEYGPWTQDLREVAAHVRLLPLEQAIADADSDGDEGEESE